MPQFTFFFIISKTSCCKVGKMLSSSKDNIQTAISCGMIDHFNKPFNKSGVNSFGFNVSGSNLVSIEYSEKNSISIP